MVTSPLELPRQQLAEAARYALLRRLAPALRHDMAGTLQPISMMAAMLEKRLQKPEPDMAALTKNGSAINQLAREASNTCMGLMTWLAPKEGRAVPLHEGVADALGLVATELSFRGFNVVDDTAGVDAELPQSVLRNVLMASLLALTDAAKGPAAVHVAADAGADGVVISLSLRPAEGEVFADGTLAYRALERADASAIAADEAVSLTWGSDRAELRWSAA